MKRGRRTPRQTAWTSSAEWKSIAAAKGRENLRLFRAMPRCDAVRKSDRQPCQNPAMPGRTKCRIHGGATPRGLNWHRPKWPKADAPDAEAKLNRKLRDLKRAADVRRRRIAAMSEDERAKYEAWQRSHKPGPPAARQQARERRRAAQEARRRLDAPARPIETTDEVRDLLATKAELERRLRELSAPVDLAGSDEGVFG